MDVRAIGGRLASSVGVGALSFAVSVLISVVGGAALAGASYYALADLPWYYGAGAAVLTLAEAVTAGVLIGGKRAIALAMAHGLQSMKLGGALVKLLFDRIIDTQTGERVAATLERLPLSKAEELLTGAVGTVTGEVGRTGGLRGAIQRRLLSVVGRYTLRRFRDEGEDKGGINLMKVKLELEQTVDETLANKVRAAVRVPTLLALLGAPVVVALQTWLIRLMAGE